MYMNLVQAHPPGNRPWVIDYVLVCYAISHTLQINFPSLMCQIFRPVKD